MKQYTTSAIQARIATGHDQSGSTTVRIYGFDQSAGDFTAFTWVQGWEEDPGYLASYGFVPIAEVTITHPYIMAGTREDVRSDLNRIALNLLMQDGTLEEDAVGQRFFSEASITAAKQAV